MKILAILLLFIGVSILHGTFKKKEFDEMLIMIKKKHPNPPMSDENIIRLCQTISVTCGIIMVICAIFIFVL